MKDVLMFAGMVLGAAEQTARKMSSGEIDVKPQGENKPARQSSFTIDMNRSRLAILAKHFSALLIKRYNMAKRGQRC